MTGPLAVLCGLGGRKRPLIASFTTAAQNDVDGYTITKPSGVASGDLLVIAACMPSANAIVAPSGFTALTDQIQGVFPAISLHTWYRRANGSEGASWTGDLPGSAIDFCAIALRITDDDTGDTPEGTDVGQSSGTAPDPPSISPSWGAGAQSLIMAFTARNSGGVSVSAYPAGYDENQISVASSGSFPVGLALATRNLVAASEDPGAYTLGGSAVTCSATVAARSAA